MSPAIEYSWCGPIDEEPDPLFDPRACRVCGCTENHCPACVARTGEPCYWVADDLCSACAGPLCASCGRLPEL